MPDLVEEGEDQMNLEGLKEDAQKEHNKVSCTQRLNRLIQSNLTKNQLIN